MQHDYSLRAVAQKRHRKKDDLKAARRKLLRQIRVPRRYWPRVFHRLVYIKLHPTLNELTRLISFLYINGAELNDIEWWMMQAFIFNKAQQYHVTQRILDIEKGRVAYVEPAMYNVMGF